MRSGRAHLVGVDDALDLVSSHHVRRQSGRSARDAGRAGRCRRFQAVKWGCARLACTSRREHSARVSAIAVQRLVALASDPLAIEPFLSDNVPSPSLGVLLGACDGFYAFESALHVFPSTPTHTQRSVSEWNAPGLWRHAFTDVTDAWCFFAEDAFGAQFGIGSDASISVLDPETGDFDSVAPDLEGWAQAILDDHRYLTGWPLAHDWQVANGALRAGRRLIPKVPFVLGGEYSVDNLYDADTVLALLYRGDVAAQIRHLPDGAKIELRVVR
jgi:hypothetical protein